MRKIIICNRRSNYKEYNYKKDCRFILNKATIDMRSSWSMLIICSKNRLNTKEKSKGCLNKFTKMNLKT